MDNIASIIERRGLLSHRLTIDRNLTHTTIGMGGIKSRRLTLPVRCHPGTHVGDYVPFYFCPRSRMLYVIHRANHEGLTYREGQAPIVTLEFDVGRVTAWAEKHGLPWAFTTTNAGAVFTEHYTGLENLDRVDWEAVAATDFRSERVKHGKDAELLVHRGVSWQLVERIGVQNHAVRTRVSEALMGAAHKPAISIRREWYY